MCRVQSDHKRASFLLNAMQHTKISRECFQRDIQKHFVQKLESLNSLHWVKQWGEVTVGACCWKLSWFAECLASLPSEHPALKAQWERGVWVKSPPWEVPGSAGLACPRARVRELVHLPRICFLPSPSLPSSRNPLCCVARPSSGNISR